MRIFQSCASKLSSSNWTMMPSCTDVAAIAVSAKATYSRWRIALCDKAYLSFLAQARHALRRQRPLRDGGLLKKETVDKPDVV